MMIRQVRTENGRVRGIEAADPEITAFEQFLIKKYMRIQEEYEAELKAKTRAFLKIPDCRRTLSDLF